MGRVLYGAPPSSALLSSNRSRAVPGGRTTANVMAMTFSRRDDVWEFEQERQAFGRWNGFCFTPRLILGPEELQLGGTYRLAITARTADTTAAPTRSFTAVSRRWGG